MPTSKWDRLVCFCWVFYYISWAIMSEASYFTAIVVLLEIIYFYFIFDMSKVIYHCGFDMHFTGACWYWVVIFVGNLLFFFQEFSVDILCSFWTYWLAFVLFFHKFMSLCQWGFSVFGHLGSSSDNKLTYLNDRGRLYNIMI